MRVLVWFVCFLSGPVFSQTESIYQTLWSLDQEQGGLVPGVEDAAGVEIVLSEQGARQGKADGAAAPLFAKVQSPKLTRPSYSAVTALFDNYEYDLARSEDRLGANPVEDAERAAFLKTVFESKVGERALFYINEKQLAGKTLTQAEFESLVETIWFEPFNNHFGGKEVGDCTGFEHVFVGEQSSEGGIGGYHFWYRFYLQEKLNQVDYLGHNYGRAEGGAQNPSIATFAMTLEAPTGTATKEITGFLVGPSPEMLISWGTIAYLQSVNQEATEPEKQGDQPISTEVEGARLDLVLYREVEKSPRNAPVRGKHIRTFYPKYLGPVSSYSQPSSPLPMAEKTKPKTPSVLRFERAQINPPGGNERGREWVEILNQSSEAIDLAGWNLGDSQGRRLPLTGTVAPGQILRIEIPSTSAVQLTNRNGSVALITPQGEEWVTRYPKTEDGEIFEWSAAEAKNP